MLLTKRHTPRYTKPTNASNTPISGEPGDDLYNQVDELPSVFSAYLTLNSRTERLKTLPRIGQQKLRHFVNKLYPRRRQSAPHIQDDETKTPLHLLARQSGLETRPDCIIDEARLQRLTIPGSEAYWGLLPAVKIHGPGDNGGYCGGGQTALPSQPSSGNNFSFLGDPNKASGTPLNNQRKRRGEDEENPEQHDGNKKARGRSTKKKVRWACPLHLYDDEEYHDCASTTLRDPSAVRRHLYRVHFHVYCPRCKMEFMDKATADQDRDKHISEGNCENSPAWVFTQGMRDRVFMPARTRGHAQRDGPCGFNGCSFKHLTQGEENWYDIWDILFPDIARPASPYQLTVRGHISSFLRSEENFLLVNGLPQAPINALFHLLGRPGPLVTCPPSAPILPGMSSEMVFYPVSLQPPQPSPMPPAVPACWLPDITTLQPYPSLTWPGIVNNDPSQPQQAGSVMPMIYGGIQDGLDVDLNGLDTDANAQQHGDTSEEADGSRMSQNLQNPPF